MAPRHRGAPPVCTATCRAAVRAALHHSPLCCLRHHLLPLPHTFCLCSPLPAPLQLPMTAPQRASPGGRTSKGQGGGARSNFFCSSSKSLQSPDFVTTLEEELFFSIVWQCFARNHSQRGRRSCAKVTLTRSYFSATTASSYSQFKLWSQSLIRFCAIVIYNAK
jgi:hypothetical protein